MYAQYDNSTKAVTGYHEIGLIPSSEIPENLVFVEEVDRQTVRDYFKYLTVNDSDPNNKEIVVRADITEYASQQDLLLQRKAEADEIYAYIIQYINEKAKAKGYGDYTTAIVNRLSSIPQLAEEGKAFSDCYDALWQYIRDNRDTFATTGQPDLATVKLEHPKYEDFEGVSAPNQSPVISNQNLQVNVGDDLQITLGSLTDPDGDTVTYTITGSSNFSRTAAENVITFNSASAGTDVLNIVASDGKGGTATATVTVQVLATYTIEIENIEVT